MNTRAMELVTNEDGRVVGVRCQQDGGFFLGNTVYNTGKNIAADLLYHGIRRRFSRPSRACSSAAR